MVAGSAAFWIAPTGRVIRVVTSHVATVIADPMTFGLRRQEIEAIYKRHDEPLGHEGFARGKILEDLIRRRWIRIREHRAYWSVQSPL